MQDCEATRASAVPCSCGIDALERAVETYLAFGSTRAAEDGWRASARVMGHDARARGVRVEELLISLKRSWSSVAGIDRLPRDESSRLLARVVTLCVEEYYAPLG
jgi:hypothetical protein